jgi:AraC-like DNA-binding protein
MPNDGCVGPVFAGSGYVFGEFHCPPSVVDRWRGEDFIGAEPHVVMPGTPVYITPAHGEAYLSTPNDLLVYDGGVRYRRRLLDARGDHCVFWMLSATLARELAIERPEHRRAPAPPRLRRRPLASSEYADSRVLRTAAARPGADRLAVDEAALWLLHRAVGATTGAVPAGAPARAGQRRRRDAVEEVKRLLADDPSRPWTLSGLGAAVHFSPFALARAFRRITGYPIHVYQRELRLRGSLEMVLDGNAGLSDIAIGHGFASHSHYTAAFRRAFGRTPSELRRSAAAGQVPRTYTVSPMAAETSRSARPSPSTSPSPTTS